MRRSRLAKLAAITCLLVALTLLIAVPTTDSRILQTIPNSGLVAYYPFNGNADDESGNGNDGTVVGATLTTDRFGNPDSAYSFDGVNDYIDLGDQQIIDDAAAFSFSLWANISGGSDDGPTMIRLKGHTSEFQYSIRVETGYAIYAGFRGFWSITCKESQCFLNNLRDEWHHHVIVYDGGNKDSLGSYMVYVDGVSISLESFNIVGGSTNANELGRDWLSLNYLEGMLDEVRIYNRALTEAEILALYYESPGVDIDIKPGSDPNSINCRNENGVIPVAILTTDDFDATIVDHTTATFEGASETHVKRTGEPRRHEEDVDGDGDFDLVFHFRFGDTDLTCESTEGTLIGETFDGQAIEGTDCVRMINPGGFLPSPLPPPPP